MVINKQLFDALGMTLIDSLWQGAIVMTVAFLGLWLMKKSQARLRHNFLLLCILALPVLGIYTFNQRFERAKPIVEISSSDLAISPSVETMGVYQEPLSTPVEVKTEAFELVEMTPWIGVIWTIGLVFVLLRSLGSYAYLNRLKSEASEIQDNEVTRLLEKLKGDFDLKKAILLRESSKVSSPMVYGFFKPIILFPLGLIQGLTMDEVEVIFLHELAHLKRNDFLINIVINGLRAVYFYHPVYWWLQSQLDNEREFASDEMVMERHADGLTLVRALTKAQEFSMLSPSIGFAGSSKNQLLKRVNRIMKKQQKPNWAGLLLPCVILLSAFLFTSQREAGLDQKQSDENLEKELIDTLPRLEFLSFDIVEPDAVQTTDDSVLTFDISGKQQKNDTITVAQATMEFLEEPSPIDVTPGDDGKPIHIKRKGKMLSGKEFEVYEKAYLKLNRYSQQASGISRLNKLAELAGIKFRDTPTTKVNDSGLRHLEMLEAQLIKQKAIWDKVVVQATSNPSEEQAKLLNAQMNKVIQIEKVIKKVVDTMPPEQRQRYERNRELLSVQDQLLELDREADLDRRLGKDNSEIIRRLDSEKAKLDKMMSQAGKSNDPESAKALQDQLVRVTELEKLALAFNKEINEVRKYPRFKSSRQSTSKTESDWNEEVENRRQEVMAQRDRLLALQQEDLFRSTVYSDDNKVYEFPKGIAAAKDFMGLVEKPIQNLGNKPILEIDGELKPDVKFSDLDQDDIFRIQVIKGKAQSERYPNGETKGYKGIIAITTVAMKDVVINSNGKTGKSPFSKKRVVYGFSEDGQKYATMVLNDARNAYENAVVVLNGKFMPKASLLEYKDAYINEINILRGERLKKYPKRKIKDFDTVIEVKTKKSTVKKN